MQIMAHSSHARSNVSIDLFNLPSLPDERRSMTMISDFPSDFYLPDIKNSRISQIINKWIFGRPTPDGNEGVGVEIPYLECAYSTTYYVVDKINGNIGAIHDNSIEPTDFFGHFGPFNLKEPGVWCMQGCRSPQQWRWFQVGWWKEADDAKHPSPSIAISARNITIISWTKRHGS